MIKILNQQYNRSTKTTNYFGVKAASDLFLRNLSNSWDVAPSPEASCSNSLIKSSFPSFSLIHASIS